MYTDGIVDIYKDKDKDKDKEKLYLVPKETCFVRFITKENKITT